MEGGTPLHVLKKYKYIKKRSMFIRMYNKTGK